MSLTGTQLQAIEALREARSPASYFAGSAVLSCLLDRSPADLDLHHRSQPSAMRARKADLILLAGRGFRILSIEQTPRETTALLVRDGGCVEINWVVDASPHLHGPQRDARLGHALGVPDE